MHTDAKIYVAGHRGLVGSALVRALAAHGYRNVLGRTHAELDLCQQAATDAFFAAEKPDYVFLAAARVGGILANNNYPADFIRDNLLIQNNLIDAAYRHGVRRLLFLGSSCIYPKQAPQPIREDYLLTGPLEPTNRPYALAKIAGVEMCWSYNRQYGTRFLAAMPTNLYGPGDNYDAHNSHVIPGLLRKFHEAKLRGDASVSIWGTGTPRREFMFSDDMADACLALMRLDDAPFDQLLTGPVDKVKAANTANNANADDFNPPLVNIGVGHDITIRKLAELIRDVTGFPGTLTFDTQKPDGTPRKLLDVTRLHHHVAPAPTALRDGLVKAYADFCAHG